MASIIILYYNILVGWVAQSV